MDSAAARRKWLRAWAASAANARIYGTHECPEERPYTSPEPRAPEVDEQLGELGEPTIGSISPATAIAGTKVQVSASSFRRSIRSPVIAIFSKGREEIRASTHGGSYEMPVTETSRHVMEVDVPRTLAPGTRGVGRHCSPASASNAGRHRADEHASGRRSLD